MKTNGNRQEWGEKQMLISMPVSSYTWKKSPRSNGLMVRAVACEARRPGFDSSSDQMVFSLLGYKEVGIKWIQTL